MYILQQLNQFIMNTSIFTFHSATAVINHLHGMAHLCCSFAPSKFPLSDFKYDRFSMLNVLIHMRTGDYKSLYIGFRTYGFESETSARAFKQRMCGFNSTALAAYVVKFVDDCYILSPLSLD